MLRNEKYKGYSIYFYDEKYEKIARNIIDKKYKVLEKYKDDKRSYVVKIEVDNYVYILKRALNETNRFRKKIRTLLKKSEALTTLININNLRRNGLKELYIPYLVVERKEKGFIKESFLLTEFIEGRVIKNYKEFTLEEKKIIVNILEEIHKKNVYHGDANHGNFIFTNNGIRVIDTVGKKEKLLNYKRNYDFITLDDCIQDIEKIHVYKKYQLSYWIASFIKKLKKRFC
ncbi:lipopolysaccharide biosynthesis protein [Cetobacterium somerae]|uniref:lipopolysaccharide core heptose(II) kinase RfaY n=1 Tax=Cetobacterium somerae TaxID=188913 RepID=UPI001F0564AE|nr:lipopolysaccharide core heptose(II) kinase RfaY [Cetobacterium somerae]UPO97392.1 lipopolysaccharide biosynthesis protein [Cetobacterium somerae]